MRRMSFVFASKTDEQINAIQNRALLPDGIYPFTVKKISQETSKTNNAMLKILIGVIDKDGQERNIIDYLVATDEMIFKLKHFCETIGFETEYTKGAFDPLKCLNRSGLVKVGTQKGGAKPDGSGYYPDKNSVKDYVKSEKKSVLEDDKPPFDDDIKF